MLAIQFYDVVLWVHITAVVVAFGAVFAYPVMLTVNARSPLAQRAGFHRLQIAFSKTVTGPAIGLVLLAGIYLATDGKYWDEPWVTIPFVLLLVIAGLGATVLRKAEEAMVATSDAGDEGGYASAFSKAKLWTGVTLGLIVLTIFIMTTKPGA